MLRYLRAALSILGLLTVLAAPPASAESIRTGGRFGLGLGSGTLANGLSAKLFMADALALQANLGTWGGGGVSHRYGRYDGVAFGADLLVEMPAFWKHRVLDLAWNIGGGAALGVSDFEDRVGAAAALVLGFEVDFEVIPLDVVVEYRPSLSFAPEVDFDLIDFTAHVRYYF